MNLAIPYEEVAKRYPVLANELVAKLRQGKSIHKDVPPDELQWSFDWCQRISGPCSFDAVIADVMNRKANPPPRPTVQERIAEVIPNLCVNLQARIGRWWARTERIPVPQEVLDSYRKGFEKDDAEYKRFNSLSKAEQGRELHEAIGQLSKSPGFAIFNVTRKP